MAKFESFDNRGIFWQDASEDVCVPEPALLISSLNDGDILEIQQEDRFILVNSESLAEFIKAIKHADGAGKAKAAKKK